MARHPFRVLWRLGWFLLTALLALVHYFFRVSPAWIGYSVEEGSVADEIAYWRDMTFLPHFLNLLSKRTIQARIIFQPSAPAGLDRRELALHLHTEVTRLAESGRSDGVVHSLLLPAPGRFPTLAPAAAGGSTPCRIARLDPHHRWQNQAEFRPKAPPRCSGRGPGAIPRVPKEAKNMYKTR